MTQLGNIWSTPPAQTQNLERGENPQQDPSPHQDAVSSKDPETGENRDDLSPAPDPSQISSLIIIESPLLKWSCLAGKIQSCSFNDRLLEHMKADPTVKNWVWCAVSIACQLEQLDDLPFPIPDNLSESLGTHKMHLLHVVRKAPGHFAVMV